MGQEFAWYDYAIFIVILAISLGVGVFFTCTGGKQKTTAEYLLANRRLGILPVCMSIVMSAMSAIVVLGSSAEFYTYGIQGWFHHFGLFLFQTLGIFMFLPFMFPLGVTSATEYLEVRFKSKVVRLVGTVSMLLSGTSYMGLSLYAPSTAISAVTPIPWWASVLAMGVVMLFYTTLGGMKAVVWTDVIQGFIYILGLLLVLGLSVEIAGGFGAMWEKCDDGGRLYVDFTPDPIIRMSFWSSFLSAALNGITSVGFAQTTVQRFSAMDHIRKAKTALMIVPVLCLLIASTVYLIGMCMFAYYHTEGCDPLLTGEVQNSNQLLPYFVLNALNRPGLPGLFVAILFSGALSSVSSAMNGNTAVTWRDLVEPYIPPQSERRKSLITKVIALCYGLIGIGLGCAYNYASGHVMMVTSTFNAALGVPLYGLFLLGSLIPWVNASGALIGCVAGFALDFTIVLGNSLTRPWAVTMNTTVEECPANTTVYYQLLEHPDEYASIWGMSYYWFAPLGLVTVVVVGALASLCTGHTLPSSQDPRYVAPVFDNTLCCLPECVRRPCRCGVRYEELERDEKGFYINQKKKSPNDMQEDIGDTFYREQPLKKTNEYQYENEPYSVHL